MKKKSILKCLALLLSSLLLVSCDFFKAGSYPNAEYYTFDISCDSLISEIKKFKLKNPQYILTEFPDSQNELDIYTFYFTLKKDTTILCVINPNSLKDKKHAILGLDCASLSPWKSQCKRINTKDLSEKDNTRIKKLFETEILDKLGKWERR